MNYVKINGVSFDVNVAISEYEENFNVLDGPNVGRTDNGHMIRDVIGTYIGHKVTFFAGKSQTEFDRLWDFILEHSVDDFVSLAACDGQREITYDAYYTSGSRKINKVEDGINYWDELQINFIPIDAQIAP